MINQTTEVSSKLVEFQSKEENIIFPPRQRKKYRRCTIQGCRSKHYAKDMCRLHYNRKYYKVMDSPEAMPLKINHSVRREKLVREILNPENNTLREAGIKAGYTKVSRTIYTKNTKTYIIKRLNELGYGKKDIAERFKLIADLALKEKDFANVNRSTENIAKLEGLFIERREIENKTPDKIMIIRDSKPIVETKVKAEGKAEGKGIKYK